MQTPLLCATVTAPDTRRALAAAEGVRDVAHLVEYRLDGMTGPEPEVLVARSPLPAILTCRPVRQGGRHSGPEEERLDLLRRGIGAGAAWIDVEADAAERIRDRGRTRFVISWHDFSGTPPDLEARLRAIEDRAPDVAKVVPTAREPGDVIRLLRLYRSARCPLAAHPMGTAGFAGRILAARFGAAMLYGAARAGAEGAPGQPAVREMREVYGLDRDLRDAPVALLLGGRLGHSVSPRMVNRALRSWGIRAVYVPWETDDPAPILDAMEELGVVGAAVTFPLKERVAALVRDLEPEAAAIGAVNTVTRTGGRLVGANTDAGAALEAIRAVRPDLAGRHAVVLGAGGAARAIAFALAGAGARITVVGRTRGRARDLAAAVGGVERRIEEVEPDSVSLLVNATPLGQWPAPGACPVPVSFLRRGMVVLDAVYNPRETRLLAAARAAGATAIPGIEMLARQAAGQVERWFGIPADPARLLAEGEEALALRLGTVVLVGMRGAGKTTVGRILARRLGMPFLDLDEEIERRAAKRIPEIFAEDGEAAFRSLEAAALEDAAGRPGIVLALGAGALGAGGRARLEGRSARVVFLRAPAEVLAARIRGSDRPPLTGLPFRTEMETLLREREPLYRAAADAEVDAAAGDPESVADSILGALAGGV